MDSSSSMANRAVLAIGLMIGFYILGLLIAGVLLFIPYAELVYAEKIHGRIAFFCVVGAGIILWSLFPRIDRFQPPGPRLTREEQPGLFEKLEEVAGRTKEKMPDEVYLTLEVNAWVTERGGWMGLGSRRVMGLGLPLLQVLRVSELQAVLAHEFGHFYGGDTKLGPWIYKTRQAIGRTLEGLSGHSELLQAPFVWYGNLFLKVTHAISRAQEFSADALAARAVGAAPLISALRAISGTALALDPYLTKEFSPVLSQGFRPPLAEGFARFVAAKGIQAAINEALDKELADGQTDPFDTHPPLRDRAQALGSPAEASGSEMEPSAVSLLTNLENLEGALIVPWFPDAAQLKSVGWDEMGRRVYLPRWMIVVREHAGALSGISPISFPEWAKDLSQFGRGVFPKGRLVPRGDLVQVTLSTLGSALAVMLYEAGWTLRAVPGEPISFVEGDRAISPFEVLNRLNKRELSAEEWRQECTEAGIANLDFGTLRAGRP